MLEIYR